jgi:quercetin dioxygenase-like cupin family protein
MPRFVLRLHADTLQPKSAIDWPACHRVLYLRAGDAVVHSGAQAAGLAADSAWHGRDSVKVTAGTAGAALLRWELVPAGAETAGGKPLLAREITLDSAGGHLLRCDRVDFPPGGIAYTHVHRGPGIRCLLAGGIRVETNGRAHDIAPGEAWFEAGPDPVLALASKEKPTAFVRVMVLPLELLGKSSIRYVRPEDADKPKLQTYRLFADEPLGPGHQP